MIRTEADMLKAVDQLEEPAWSWDDIVFPLVREEKQQTVRHQVGFGKNRKSGGYQRRFKAIKPHANREWAALPVDNPAVVSGRSIFQHAVKSPAEVPRVLIEGENNSKTGNLITRGDWANCRIYTLTLEERATCPTSCALWRECYGNSMPYARRHRHGPELEEALAKELQALQERHPGGFAIRLHVLGDFYSLAYVRRWLEWMAQFPALHVWGYTAHPIASEIGWALDAGNDIFPDRWSMRFSLGNGIDAPAPDQSYLVTTIWRQPEAEVVPEGIVCPAQMQHAKSCATCGLCWAKGARYRRIVFVGHGRRNKGSADMKGASP